MHVGSLVMTHETLGVVCGLGLPGQRLNLAPLPGEHGVLATGLPGKFLSVIYISVCLP